MPRALLLIAVAVLAGCYATPTSIAQADRESNAAYVGARLDEPGAVKTLVDIAARGVPDGQAVLADRLVTLPAGPLRDRLDGEVVARLHAGDPGIQVLHLRLASDLRPPFRAAAARLAALR